MNKLKKMSKLKKVIIRKIIFVALITIAVIFVGVINQSLSVMDNSIEVGASMDVMSGNLSTTGGMTTIFASSSALSAVRIILKTVIVILLVCLIFDSVKDGIRLFKEYSKEN